MVVIVFIDRPQVNSGTATKNYPTSDSVIVFGAQAYADLFGAQAYADLDTTRWDYIRTASSPTTPARAI